MYRGKEDARTALQLSEQGKACIVVVYGHDLSPIIESAQPVVVEPICDSLVIGRDDIVFCRINKHYRMRRVITVKKGNRYAVSNNPRYINGTISRNAIYGRAIRILREKNFNKKG